MLRLILSIFHLSSR